MHAYVINLARSPERRAHITAQLDKAGVDYEIVTGVEGRDVDLTDTTKFAPAMLTLRECPEAMAGCALSHLRVYQKIVADGLEAALVLEDDVSVPSDLSSVADQVGAHLTGAEVALLNYDSREICYMSREGAVGLSSSRQLVTPIDIRLPRSAAGYIVTREACERMSERMLPIRAQTDAWSFFYREGIVDRVRCVVPQPVSKSPEFASLIGRPLGTGLKARLAALLVRYKIPLVHQVISYRRERIHRQWTRWELVDMPFTEKPSRID